MGEASQEKLPNRWIRVIGAVLIQLALGSIYAWSIFNKPLTDALGMDPATEAKSLQVLGIFATSLAGFGLFVSVGGRLQDKYGPRNIAMLAGVIYAAAYILSWQSINSLPMMYVAYGMLGAGVGIGYSCPLSCCVKWFPDKRGLISGIAVAGFGAGTFIFAQVGTFIIGDDYSGLGTAYLALGLIFLVMVIAGAFLLCDPPSGFCPAGWTPPLQGAGSTAKKQFQVREMVRTKSFIMIWIMFVLSATCGLMMVGNISNVANSFKSFYDPPATSLLATTAESVALLAGIYAIFNGTGRVAWGFFSDKLGRTKAMKIMFLVQAIGLFSSAAFVISKPTDEGLQFAGLILFDSWVGFCFGGNFALFPPITSEYFGTKFFGSNYGIVFTSYAVGGVIGGLMPGIIKGGFEWVFIITGIGSLAAFAIAWLTKPPVVEPEPAKAAA